MKLTWIATIIGIIKMLFRRADRPEIVKLVIAVNKKVQEKEKEYEATRKEQEITNDNDRFGILVGRMFRIRDEITKLKADGWDKVSAAIRYGNLQA